jgi:predicted phage terminase large subunit-like protein
MVQRGRGGILVVQIPPQHGKSELISHRFPVWLFDLDPSTNLILASYGADLAEGFGKQVRNTIQSEPDQVRARISRDTAKGGLWKTTAGGLFRAVGVGGGLTGHGGTVGLIDDPVKDFREALSQASRDAHWDWWASTFTTRLRKNAIIVLMMTRWHTDDLAGRVIENERDVEVITFRALAEDDDPLGRPVGEPLNPYFKTKEELEAHRARSPSWFSALYQQRPVARAGAMFNRTWFEIVPSMPNLARRVRYWDRAATKPKAGRTDPDWTAGALVGQIEDTFYVADVHRFRGTPLDNEKEIHQTAILDRAEARRSSLDVRIRMEQEPGSAGVDMIAHYQGRVLLGYPFEGDRPTGDKVLRAEPLASAAQAGRVKLVAGPWNRAFLDEVEMFPHGPHDDQVDAVSGAVLSLSGDVEPMLY